MRNLANEMTDQELQKLERKIRREYSQAWKELDEKYMQYLEGWDEYRDGKKIHHKGLEERWAEEYQAYKQGKYTKQQFEDWYTAQIARGKRWADLRDQMAKRMGTANDIARAYTNGALPSIYALNHNHSGMQIESVNAGMNFTIIDENTAKRLLEEQNHVSFDADWKHPERNKKKRAEYAWNSDRITKALFQGIVQGEAPRQIAKRFLQVMGSNQSAAIRNARTSFTSAQNGGRQDSYEQAAKRGTKLLKEWMATLDDRTRSSHGHLDGERVPHNKPFSNKLMYPGDPSGEGSEVYNCRCTMVAVLPGVNDETNNREYYEEWLKKKTPRFDLKNKGLQKYTRKEIEKMAHVAKDIADKYLKRPSKWKGKIEVDDKQNRNAKLWDCSIIATSETAPHILLHEQFHAKSISYYDPDTYDLHRNIEEATVQYLTQEVSKIEDIIIIESGYDDMVDSLREINKLIGGYSDLQFAQKLMQIDTPDRLDYLENYVYNYLKDVDIDTAIRINELMDVIR